MIPSQKRLLFFVAAVLAVASYVYWKSDTHRLSLFHSHKSDYEVLLNMLHEDAVLTFINSSLTVPKDPAAHGISAQRIAQYRRYMSKIGCGAISYGYASSPVLFVSDTTGAPNILYFSTHSAEDAKKSGVPGDKPPVQAHHIEGNWYLSSENF
jgi:hypothetical protein